MTDYIKAYNEYLNERNASANTVASYMRDLEQFFDYLNAKGVNVLEVDKEFIGKFMQHLKDMGKGASTVNRMVATLRNFYKYLMMSGETDHNPTQGIRTQKVEKKLPETLTVDEVSLLLAQPDVTELKGSRDKAILELLYATGMRVTELIDLNIDDVNIRVGIVNCHSRGRERIIPIYRTAVKALSDYIQHTRNIIISGGDGGQALFTNMNGKRLTRQGAWMIIKEYTEMAKINKDITPHTLRHSFAAHLLENGVDIKDLQEMLGHADISSTQVYSQLIKEKYQNTYARFHPRARIG